MNITERFKAGNASRTCRIPYVGLLFAICLGGWTTNPATAGPAYPDAVEVSQPGGAKIKITLHGDEFFSWHETPEGYAIVKDPTDQIWRYARPAAARAEFQAVPDARVDKTNPERLGLKKHAMPEAGALRDHLRARRKLMGGTANPMPSTPTVPQDANPIPQGVPILRGRPVKNIVLLTCFADHWDTGAGTVLTTKGRVATTEYNNLFNQVGLTSDGASGSVRDYYYEVSCGKLTIQSVISSWLKLPQIESYYDATPSQMVADAITAAATAGFDFSQGDSDGDGWVDMLTIIHSGYGQEFTGNPTTSIWSHKGSLAATVTKNGVKMYNYSTEPALRGWITDTPPSIVRIGSICHETGHVFGLPDLYDYSDQTYGLGCYCIMSNGGSNGASAKPAHMCAWAKCFLGFVNPEQIHSQTAVSMPQVETSPVIKLLRDGMSNGEYFLIENRERSGFDNDPNIIPGIIIYHVDTNSSNNGLGAWPHPVVKIEEADGDNSLGAKTAFSESGDAWTSTNGLTGGFRDQTGKPNTNAMRYQTGPYSRTDSAAYYSYNTLSGFSAAGSTMTFNATTLNTTIANQTSTTGNYTVSWPACANATQYELQESVRSNLTSFTDGAEDEDAMYENWNLAGTVKRDSTGKRSGTYCYAMNLAFNSIWGSDMQALTQRKPFTATSSTVVSFYFMSHLTTGDGALSCQISNDNGSTWKVLGSYSGTASEAWQPQSYNFAAMSAAGITSGDQCLLRFIANFEFTFGTATFPGYGFALDDISITGTSIAGYSSWTSLAGNLTTTSYSRTGKPSGTYGYRVRAYSNAVWQSFGATGETTVAIPLTVTINQAAAQADPTNGATVNFTVVFNQPITVFDSGKIIISGTTPGTKAITVTGSGTVYNVAVSGMTGPGTVIATVAARAAAGLDGLASPASTSTDNTVTFDATPPQVTISQAAGQTDPTATSTINFTAVFSEQVNDFTAGDVTISGTAPGTKTVTVTGTGAVYNVEVSGMTGVGKVTATIAAGVVHDKAGNPNTAATSVDNTVTLVLTQHQTWLQLWFGTTTGTGQAADTEDPNHNGISNLMEYALGGDPVGRTTGTAILPKATRDTHGSLQSSFTRYTDRTGLTLTVQGADSAAGPWADLASSTNGTAFVATLPYVTVAETGTGGSRAVTVTDIFHLGTAIPTNRFMRLRVSTQ